MLFRGIHSSRSELQVHKTGKINIPLFTTWATTVFHACWAEEKVIVNCLCSGKNLACNMWPWIQLPTEKRGNRYFGALATTTRDKLRAGNRTHAANTLGTLNHLNTSPGTGSEHWEILNSISGICRGRKITEG